MKQMYVSVDKGVIFAYTGVEYLYWLLVEYPVLWTCTGVEKNV